MASSEAKTAHLLEVEPQVDLLDQVSRIYDSTHDRFTFPRTTGFWRCVDKAHTNGFRGQTQHIAVVDTGADLSLPILRRAVVKSADFTTKRQSSNGPDEHGHGTIVMLLLLSIAPEAEIFNAKVMGSNGEGDTSAVIAGLNWAREQKATVVNLSLGRSSRSRLLKSFSRPKALEDFLAKMLEDPVATLESLRRLRGHRFVKCGLCRAASKLARDIPVCAAVGNFSAYSACPARAEGVTAVGGASVKEMSPTLGACTTTKAIALPSFAQTLGADAGLVAFDLIPGSSMLSPLQTGLFALGLSRSDFTAFSVVIDMVGLGDALLTAGVRPGETSAAEAAIQCFLRAFSLAPHNHVHPNSVPGSECWQCALYLSSGVTDLGLAYLRLNWLEKAESTLRDALKLAPWSAEGWMNLGAVLRKREQFREAVSAYETAREFAPANARIYEGLGTTYEMLGMPREALANYQQALSFEKDAPVAREAVERLRGVLTGLRSPVEDQSHA